MRLEADALVSLKYAQDTIDTHYLGSSRGLGQGLGQYRQADRDWQSINATPATAGESDSPLAVESRFEVSQDEVLWTVTTRNTSDEPLEIGDMALPLPIGGRWRRRS